MVNVTRSISAGFTDTWSAQASTTLTVRHPRGGVSRSTTVYMLGAELALRPATVALSVRDHGQHLPRTFDFCPPTVIDGADPQAALRIVDTAPEVNADRAIGYLHETDRALVPVKEPEAVSVLALPLLLEWLEETDVARLQGFLPTIYKARRSWRTRASPAKAGTRIRSDRRPGQRGVVQDGRSLERTTSRSCRRRATWRTRLGANSPSEPRHRTPPSILGVGRPATTTSGTLCSARQQRPCLRSTYD